jgi:hypothetical protein
MSPTGQAAAAALLPALPAELGSIVAAAVADAGGDRDRGTV